MDKRFSEAPVFYWLYTLLIGGGAAFVLIPGLPLLKMLIWSQVANGVLLPFVITFMLVLVNRPRLMGNFRNNRWQNAVAWTTAVAMVIISTIMIYTSLRD